MASTVRPTRPLFWSKRHRDAAYDTLVIGSGMGGMTAAAVLAKLGHKVLVLEQHYVPGGFTHTFTRKGWTWDVGVHAVGEVTERSLPGRLLGWVTDDRLEWVSLGPVYDTFHYPGLTVDFPDSPEQLRANLLAAFPAEAAAIDAYLALARQIARATAPYYLSRVLPKGVGVLAERWGARDATRWFARNTADVLAELTSDERLRALFVAQWGYYGSPPSRSSFAMQALVVRHFQHGAYYPVGGSGAIARELLRTVAEAGGWTRIVADVAQILVEDGRAVGVRLATGEELRAPNVVSAIGVAATVGRLLPEPLRGAEWGRTVTELPAAAAHVCLYIGFEGDIRAAGASAANQWFYETWDPEEGAWHVRPDAPFGRAPALYCSFPSLKDPLHDPGPTLRHTGEVVTFVPWEAFAPWRGTRHNRRGADYEAFKARIHEQMLAQFLDHMPALRPYVAYTELSTPLSTDTFVRPRMGSIYGLEPTPARFANPWLRARSPVPGLAMAGAEVTTVGVVGALMGGLLAAVAVEPIAAMRRVQALRTARR